MRCVSWNIYRFFHVLIKIVAPRMRCVSWNIAEKPSIIYPKGCTSYEVCELECVRDDKGTILGCCTSYEVCELECGKNPTPLFFYVAPRMRCVS